MFHLTEKLSSIVVVGWEDGSWMRWRFSHRKPPGRTFILQRVFRSILLSQQNESISSWAALKGRWHVARELTEIYLLISPPHTHTHSPNYGLLSRIKNNTKTNTAPIKQPLFGKQNHPSISLRIHGANRSFTSLGLREKPGFSKNVQRQARCTPCMSFKKRVVIQIKR